MNPDPDIILLLQIWNDPDASEESRSRLLHRLESDDAFRSKAAEQLAMIAALRAAQAPEPRWLELHDLMDGGSPDPLSGARTFEDSVMAKIQPTPSTRKPQQWTWLAIAALAALAIGSNWWFGALGTRMDQPVNPLTSAAPSQHPIASVIELKIPEGSPVPPGLSNGSILEPGPLELVKGTITIQTIHGVTVSMRAPLRANLVSMNEIEVTEGNLLARIPQDCMDFRMHGPSLQVQDLGAEAIVSGGLKGSQPVRVFEARTDLAAATPGSQHSINSPPSNSPAKEKPAPDLVEDDGSSGRSLLAIGDYPQRVLALRPSGYWRFSQMISGKTLSELPEVPPMEVVGDATLTAQASDNWAGELFGNDRIGAFRPHFRPDMMANDFTITFWVQARSQRSGALISATRSDDREKAFFFLLLASPDRIGTDAGLRLQLGLNHAEDTDKPNYFTCSELMKPGDWHHIAAVRERLILRLYLDGKEIGSGPSPEGKPAFTRMLLGRLNAVSTKSGTKARAFDGCIDELAMFERALDGNDISSLAKTARNQPAGAKKPATPDKSRQ